MLLERAAGQAQRSDGPGGSGTARMQDRRAFGVGHVHLLSNRQVERGHGSYGRLHLEMMFEVAVLSHPVGTLTV